MWGSTIIIDRIADAANAENLKGKQEDKLIFTWEQRRWMRGRFTTALGRKIGIALPTGTTPAPGTILYVGTDWYLRIEAAPEAVLEILPADCAEAVKIAFEVGNLHFPLAHVDGKILVPDDKAMVRLMERLGVSYERQETIFDPIANSQSNPHG
jgi:urease accessory protein UreE